MVTEQIGDFVSRPFRPSFEETKASARQTTIYPTYRFVEGETHPVSRRNAA